VFWPTVQFSRSGEKTADTATEQPKAEPGLSKLNSMQARQAGQIQIRSTFRDAPRAELEDADPHHAIAPWRDRRLWAP